MRTLVLDTNVLLADPGVLFAFPDARIIIPETVLGELDKLKTSRADPDLRFRGREVSRMLFDLSEQGSLIGGVELPDGGTLRVAPLEADADLPEGLATRNADDRILAVAYQVCKSECDGLTLITNDLNMLLKAQALGIDVERYADGVEGGFARRYIVRPFQRYKIPLGILGMSLGVFAAILVTLMFLQPAAEPGGSINVPTELKETFNSTQSLTLSLLQDLERDPNNANALLRLANIYHEYTNYARAVQYYKRYVELAPSDLDARTDLAASYFYSGDTDAAIKTVNAVLADNPDHVQAAFNLGIFYWKGRRDFNAATRQFERVLEIVGDSPAENLATVRTHAANNISAISAEMTGQSTVPTGGVQ
jgi:tetratricopeptide (TPR) repeat protein